MPATTFTYNTATGNSYAWSVASNWTTPGSVSAVPGDGANLVIPGVGGDVSFDNLGSLSVFQLNMGSSTALADVVIAAGDTLETGGLGPYSAR